MTKRQDATNSFTPTILLHGLATATTDRVVRTLEGEGWDIRVGEVDLSKRSDSEVAPAEPASIVAAARSIQPDVVLVTGTAEDPWAFKTVCEMRSEAATQDLGLIVCPDVSVPEDLDVTPMSGADTWIFPSTGPARVLEAVRRTAALALEGKLEWAHREWTASDRNRHQAKRLRIKVELGRPVDAEQMAEWLYGRRSAVDIRQWGPGSSHSRGWRFGSSRRFRRPLVVLYEQGSGEMDVAEQTFTLFARSGRLLLAAGHAVSDLTGGWPSIEL